MSSRNIKIVSFEGNFSFNPKIKIARQGSIAIIIGPRSQSDLAHPFSIGREDEIILREVADLRGQIRIPRAPHDKEQSTISYEKVSSTNFRQPRDFTILMLELDDWVTQVTNKLVGGNFIIIAFMCMYEFGYLFSLQWFIKDVFCYNNLSLAQLYPNRWTYFSTFKKLLGIFNMEPMFTIFRHCYMIINNIDNGLPSLSSFPFLLGQKGL